MIRCGRRWGGLAAALAVMPAALGGCAAAEAPDGDEAAQDQPAAIEEQMRRVDDPDHADDPTRQRVQ